MMSKRSAFLFVLSLSVFVSSCQTTPSYQQAEISCSAQDRVPASEFCSDVFKANDVKTPQALTLKEAQDQIVQISNKNLSAAEIARLWEPLSFRRDWSRTHDDAFWASLIGRERLEEAKTEGVHPVTIFGEETSFNWQSSLRRLQEIPIGKLQLNLNLVSDVNRDIISADRTYSNFIQNDSKAKVFTYPGPIKAMFNKHYPLYGGTYRRKSLYNLHNVFKSISESEYQNILANTALTGISFQQMPWSRQGKRFGIFRYPSAQVYRTKHEALIKETNDRIEAIRSKRSSEDPIDLAAEFQWRFVQLHPLVNGNGRTGRAIMTRILQEFGLPPSSRRMIDVDYTLSLKEQKDLVREGVIESLRLAAADPKGRDQTRVTPYRRGFGTRLTTKEIQEMSKGLITENRLTNKLELFPESPDQIVRIGGHKFTISDDLLFIDQYGVPFTAQYKAGRFQLFPIADRTYTLLGWGGKLNDTKGLMRDLNPHLESLMTENIELLRQLAQKPEMEAQILVNSYTTVERANHTGDYQFADWQIPLLMEVTKINEDPRTQPMAVLVQNRGDRTKNPRLGRDYFEKAFFQKEEVLNTSEIIGHYMMMDQRYFEIQNHLETNGRALMNEYPELKTILPKQIRESRQKLHTAARTLLKPFIQEVSSMTPQSREYLMRHPQFRLVYEYFIRTPLAFESMDVAARHLDMNKTVVLRSAAHPRVRLTGFMSDSQVRDAIWGIPMIGPRFEGFIRELDVEFKKLLPSSSVSAKAAQELADSSVLARITARHFQDNTNVRLGVRAMLEYFFLNPHENRSLDPESAREFVTQYLHTQMDLGPKEQLSTTLNPSYLLGEKDGKLQAKFAWNDATIYIIEAPRTELNVDITSGFVIQQEVGMQPMNRRQARRAIQFKLKADEYNTFFAPKESMPASAKKAFEASKEVPAPQ